MWFDRNGNGQLDSQGYFERRAHTPHHQDGTVTEKPGEWYYWQRPDLYSDIHEINTDSEVFDIDIEGGRQMDFLADVQVGDNGTGNVIDFFIS